MGEELTDRAARQHGLVTREQARKLGVQESALRHGVAAGRLIVVTRRVLRLAGSPETKLQRAMAAVLDAGPTAAASYHTAAWLWGLPGFWFGPLHVSRPHSGSRGRPALATLHQPRTLPTEHCAVLQDVPVTTLARTLFDLAGDVHLARAERAVDNALARSPALLARLHALLDELGERGRNGAGPMRAILAERPPGYVPPASGLEAKAIALLKQAGIQTERQVNLGSREAWIGRFDLRVRHTPVVIEIDSGLHHTALLDHTFDLDRDRQAAAAGLTVVRVTDQEVWSRPAEVVGKVRAALSRAA